MGLFTKKLNHKLQKEYTKDNKYTKEFLANQRMNIDMVVEIIKSYEDESTKMTRCYCFNIAGEHKPGYNYDELRSIYMEFDDESQRIENHKYFAPIVSVSFEDIYTHKYKFELFFPNDKKTVWYQVDYSKLK